MVASLRGLGCDGILDTRSSPHSSSLAKAPYLIEYVPSVEQVLAFTEMAVVSGLNMAG
jgi:hypothetical protein